MLACKDDSHRAEIEQTGKEKKERARVQHYAKSSGEKPTMQKCLQLRQTAEVVTLMQIRERKNES